MTTIDSFKTLITKALLEAVYITDAAAVTSSQVDGATQLHEGDDAADERQHHRRHRDPERPTERVVRIRRRAEHDDSDEREQNYERFGKLKLP